MAATRVVQAPTGGPPGARFTQPGRGHGVMITITHRERILLLYGRTALAVPYFDRVVELDPLPHRDLPKCHGVRRA